MAAFGVRGRSGHVLTSLDALSWKVARLHHTPRGSLIVTALKNGRIAALELPTPRPDEPHPVWMNRLSELLSACAYDPTDTAPPVLMRIVSEELADLMPQLSAAIR